MPMSINMRRSNMLIATCMTNIINMNIRSSGTEPSPTATNMNTRRYATVIHIFRTSITDIGIRQPLMTNDWNSLSIFRWRRWATRLMLTP